MNLLSTWCHSSRFVSVYLNTVIIEKLVRANLYETADGVQTDADGDLLPVQSKHGDLGTLWNVGY